MSDHSRRIATLKAIVRASKGISGVGSSVLSELTEVSHARAVNAKSRRRLLQVLHSARALDSALKEFTSFHGCGQGHSLGYYLKALHANQSSTLKRKLTAAEKHRFQSKIVNLRNHYMHTAGAFPSDDREILGLLSDMEDCLVTVASLE